MILVSDTGLGQSATLLPFLPGVTTGAADESFSDPLMLRDIAPIADNKGAPAAWLRTDALGPAAWLDPAILPIVFIRVDFPIFCDTTRIGQSEK